MDRDQKGHAKAEYPGYGSGGWPRGPSFFIASSPVIAAITLRRFQLNDALFKARQVLRKEKNLMHAAGTGLAANADVPSRATSQWQEHRSYPRESRRVRLGLRETS